MRRMYSLNQLQEIALKKIESTTSLKVFENIVDKDGHKRFIEGDINFEEITGVTKTYGKWSLSGSHLMMVLGLTFENGTTINNAILGKVYIPKWIHDKVAVLWSATGIALESFNAIDANTTTQTLTSVVLGKETDYLSIVKYGSLTFTSTKSARIEFDLLIDNE